MMRNERITGIYPESGIEQAYAQEIADFKRDVLGHQYPVLVNNFTNIKEITSRPKVYTQRQISGKTVVSKINENDEHVAGLVWGKSDQYLIRFTDGRTEVWDSDKVHQNMVGVPGKKVLRFIRPGAHELTRSFILTITKPNHSHNKLIMCDSIEDIMCDFLLPLDGNRFNVFPNIPGFGVFGAGEARPQ